MVIFHSYVSLPEGSLICHPPPIRLEVTREILGCSVTEKKTGDAMLWSKFTGKPPRKVGWDVIWKESLKRCQIWTKFHEDCSWLFQVVGENPSYPISPGMRGENLRPERKEVADHIVVAGDPVIPSVDGWEILHQLIGGLCLPLFIGFQPS